MLGWFCKYCYHTDYYSYIKMCKNVYDLLNCNYLV